jgi:hypothetical protein
MTEPDEGLVDFDGSRRIRLDLCSDHLSIVAPSGVLTCNAKLFMGTTKRSWLSPVRLQAAADDTSHDGMA